MKRIMMSAAIALMTVAFAASADETVLHVPFDSGLAAVESEGLEPLVFSEGGSVAFPDEGVQGTNVLAVGYSRSNAGFVRLQGASVWYDLTSCGLTDAMTIEFSVRTRTTEAWFNLIALGMRRDTPNAGADGLGEPFLFLLQVFNKAEAETDWPIALRADFADSASGTVADKWCPSFREFCNGEWHRVSLTYEPVQAGGTTLTARIDGKTVKTYTSSRSWSCATTADRPHLYLKLAGGSSVVDFDELRIAKAALPRSALLRVSDATAPQDGETILHMPFDGNCGTLAHAEESPALLSGEPTYSDEVLHADVRTGAVSRVRVRTNAKCLEMAPNTTLSIDLPHWALARGALDSATIEFFVKSEASDAPDAWVSPFAITRGDSPFAALLQISGEGNYQLRMDGSDDSGEVISLSYRAPVLSSDGRWHHVAYTVLANPDGSSTVRQYFDRAEVASKVFPKEKAWRGVDEGMRLFLRGGVRRYWFDELRVTKGVLPKAAWLRLEGETREPEDGEALLHMTFDGTCDSLARIEDPPVVKSGKPTYSQDVWKPVVVARDRRLGEWRENKGCLCVNRNASLQIALPYVGLDSEHLMSATIEFFVKGETNADPGAWNNPMKIAAADLPFMFLLQTWSDGQYNFRADAYADATPTAVASCNYRPGVMPSDGQWHHVALTVAENEHGTSTFTCYFDHKRVGEPVVASAGSWKGLAPGMSLQFRSPETMAYWYDELRISKGVLDPSRFLCAGYGGMALIVR